MSIKSIPTQYGGVLFRSRLEARWAVFFDSCGWDWAYEQEGYTIDGVNYLPDFRLYNVNRRSWDEEDAAKPFFIEVKGVMDDASRTKIDALASYYPVYVVKDIPCAKNKCLYDFFTHIDSACDFDDDYRYFSFSTVDGDLYPCGLFADKMGRPVLRGPDHCLDDIDWDFTQRAYVKAQTFKFN
jgi:hypothetical protein